MAVSLKRKFFCPIQKLKSSPIPVDFISFNQNDNNCDNCGAKYSETLLFKQKYCRRCLLQYVDNISDNFSYLDIHISTINTQCSEHKAIRNIFFFTRNIKEWCEKCSIISFFKQIPTNSLAYYDENFSFEVQEKLVETENDCKFCGKLIYQETLLHEKLKICSDCYQVSHGSIESTLTKKDIPVIYLPWWDAFDTCAICKVELVFESSNQKWCPHCFMVYVGCRHCLTTNIIFGYTDRSQCGKCKRIMPVTMNKINLDSNNIDYFLYSTRNINDIGNMANIDKYDNNPLNVYDFLKEKTYGNFNPETVMEWIPFSRIKDLEKVANGGFGTIYQATWLDGGVYGTVCAYGNRKKYETIAVKLFTQDISKRFLNELKSYRQYYTKSDNILRYYGITKNPETNEYMLVMEYANGGNLHNYLQKNFKNITWKEKLEILLQIAKGLKAIHNANFTHRDLHSGNILYKKRQDATWLIADFGLTPVANNIPSEHIEIYGVIPYIAPEVINGFKFSKESDIYSLGMIMWELTTGYRPFADIEHDFKLIYKIIDGKRPEITEDTPECFVNLLKRSWAPDPIIRPPITEIYETYSLWNIKKKYSKHFNQSEEKRNELILLNKLGPEFTEKSHPNAIYISRRLTSIISFKEMKENKRKEKESSRDFAPVKWDSYTCKLLLLFLIERKKDVNQLKMRGNNAKRVKKKLWHDASAMLSCHNYKFSAENCEFKWKNMMHHYKINAGFQFKAEVEEILDINRSTLNEEMASSYLTPKIIGQNRRNNMIERDVEKLQKVNIFEAGQDFGLLDERISYTAEERPRKVNKSETGHDFSLLDERISYTAEDSLYFDEERTEAEHDFGLLKERSTYISEAQQEFSILTDLYLTKPNEITLK